MSHFKNLFHWCWEKINTGLGWAGLGLGWAGLGWAGLGWAGLGWAGLGWAGLGWAGLGWAGLGMGFSSPPAPNSSVNQWGRRESLLF